MWLICLRGWLEGGLPTPERALPSTLPVTCSETLGIQAAGRAQGQDQLLSRWVAPTLAHTVTWAPSGILYRRRGASPRSPPQNHSFLWRTWGTLLWTHTFRSRNLASFQWYQDHSPGVGCGWGTSPHPQESIHQSNGAPPCHKAQGTQR